MKKVITLVAIMATTVLLVGCNNEPVTSAPVADITPVGVVVTTAPAPVEIEATPTVEDAPKPVAQVPTPKPEVTAPVAPVVGGDNVAAGEVAFAAKGCSTCHGAGGVTPMPGGLVPALAGVDANILAKGLIDFKSGARQDSKMFVMNNNASSLTDADIDNIAAYLTTQTPAK